MRWRGSATRAACSPAALDAPYTVTGRGGSSSTQAVFGVSRPSSAGGGRPRTAGLRRRLVSREDVIGADVDGPGNGVDSGACDEQGPDGVHEVRLVRVVLA